MATRFIPEVIEEQEVTRTVTEIVEGFTNCPPVRTPIRATLGETVIVGKVHSQNFHGGGPRYQMLYIKPDSTAYDSTLSCWFSDGWEFEILGEPEPLPTPEPEETWDFEDEDVFA